MHKHPLIKLYLVIATSTNIVYNPSDGSVCLLRSPSHCLQADWDTARVVLGDKGGKQPAAAAWVLEEVGRTSVFRMRTERHGTREQGYATVASRAGTGVPG